MAECEKFTYLTSEEFEKIISDDTPCVMPFVVATKMSGVKKKSLSSPLPDSYVKSVLARVGIANRIHGYWPHEMEGFIAGSILPVWIRNKMVMSILKKLREKAHAKRKAKKES